MESTQTAEARTAWTFLSYDELWARRLQNTFGCIDAVHAFHNQLVTGDPSFSYLD
jgi:hypothetical protein